MRLFGVVDLRPIRIPSSPASLRPILSILRFALRSFAAIARNDAVVVKALLNVERSSPAWNCTRETLYRARSTRASVDELWIRVKAIFTCCAQS